MRISSICIMLINLQLYYSLISSTKISQSLVMIGKTHFDKHTEVFGGKIKNDEKSNKKFKKNKNDSPIKIKKVHDKPIRTKDDHLLRENKAIITDRSLSKSKQKLPNKLTIQHSQKTAKEKKIVKRLNTSPVKEHKIQPNFTHRKSPQPKSKSRSPSTSRKNTTNMALKDHHEISPLKNTKRQLFYTQKKEKSPTALKQKHKSKDKKRIKVINQSENKGYRDEQNTFLIDVENQDKAFKDLQEVNQKQFQQYLQSKVKSKREIPQIRTQFSGRKKSYIDDSLLKKLQNHKSNKNFDFIESCFIRSVQQQGKNQQNRREKLKTNNDESKKLNESAQILNFRKEQERKWCTMLQQIKQLKNQTQVSQKIDYLIKQITQNYNNLQIQGYDGTKSKKSIVQSQSAKTEQQQHQQQAQADLTYTKINQINEKDNLYEDELQISPIEPDYVRIQEPRSHMISLDDFFQSSQKKNARKSLFQEDRATIQPNITEIIPIQGQIKQEVKNQIVPRQQEKFKNEIELQLFQLKSFQLSHQAQDNTFLVHHEYENEFNECSAGEALDLDKIAYQIESRLFIQVCTNIMNNKRLLHYFLFTFDQTINIPKLVQNEVFYPLQPSTHEYVFYLINRLLDYIFKYYKQFTLKQIAFYYECKASQILRYVRSTHLQEQQDEISYQIQNQNQIQIPFFNLAKIQEFQSQELKNSQYLPNYFTFNQCVYDAFNDVFDKARPYGPRGKSIFTLQLSHPPKTVEAVREQILRKFYGIFRYQFDEQFYNQELTHGEEGDFEVIYFVSLQVMECIYNEAILQVYRLMKRKIFQQ